MPDETPASEPTCLSYLVANWNGGHLLAECLDSIRAQDLDEPVEVVVIDNGSTDRSWDLPHFDSPGWKLVRLPANTGFAAANNLAFGMTRGRFIALVNNDVRLAPDWSRRLIAALRAHPEAGSAACRILSHARPDLLDSAGFAWHGCASVTDWKGSVAARFTGQQHPVFGPVASAAIYARAAIETTGFFRDAFFAYYEDTDLAARLVLHGYTCLYVDEASALHHGSATGGRASAFRHFHLRRNIEYLFWINMVGWLALRHLPAHVLYEALAFLHALRHGRGLVVLTAKAGFLRRLGWVCRERRRLRSRLQHAGRWPAAQRDLAARLLPLSVLRVERRVAQHLNANSVTSPEDHRHA